MPQVHAYILCWNEELMLPYTLDHYSRFCSRITLLDNMSDDSSLDIAKCYPNVIVKQWDSGGQFHDGLHARLKSSVYKNSRNKCDWVLVCDCDEFLFGWEHLNDYRTEGLQTPQVIGFQMVSRFFPTYDGRPIHEVVKRGYRDTVFDKQVLFDPGIDIEFGFGAHKASVAPQNPTSAPPLRLLHYKFLGPTYMRYKNQRSFARLSGFNKARGLGFHYNPDFEAPEVTVCGLLKLCTFDALRADIS
jgi:hypothetical protein